MVTDYEVKSYDTIRIAYLTVYEYNRATKEREVVIVQAPARNFSIYINRTKPNVSYIVDFYTKDGIKLYRLAIGNQTLGKELKDKWNVDIEAGYNAVLFIDDLLNAEKAGRR